MCTWISLINPYHRLEVLLLLTLLCISFKTMCARYAKVGFKVLGSVHYLSTEGSGQKVGGGRKKIDMFWEIPREIFFEKVLKCPKRCKKLKEKFLGGSNFFLKFPESRFRASKWVLGPKIWYFLRFAFFFFENKFLPGPPPFINNEYSLILYIVICGQNNILLLILLSIRMVESTLSFRENGN